MTARHNRFIIAFGLAFFVASLAWASPRPGALTAAAESPRPTLLLVQEGQPKATIVLAGNPTPAAAFAALELRYHIKRITGVELPLVNDRPVTSGARILVGESEATAALGMHASDFGPLEYRIQITPEAVILIGRDWQDTPAHRAETGRSVSGYSLQSARQVVNYAQVTHGYGPNRIELPGLFDEQGTCYAVYDFLERFCGVRWYGPTELNVISPSTNTLAVPLATLQRSKDLKLVDGFGGGWPIINQQWNQPTEEELAVFNRRLRAGGERWSANHTIHEATMRPGGIFGDPSFRAIGSANQLCYSHRGLIRTVAQLARDYFDGAYTGRDLPSGIQAMGDYLALVPNDSANWCQCTNCAPILARSRQDTRGRGQFSHAADSYYIFNFINEVAKLVRLSHPNKFIAALAYWGYYYKPLGLELEPNISVAPCIQTCYAYVPATYANELAGYNEWVEDSRRTGRRLFMWNYFHHPMEPAVIGGWHCFPEFMPHAVSTEVKRYIRDGVHGVYLCGIGQQLDHYIYMKTAFDVNTDCDQLVDEFFTRYFEGAGAPLKRFYLRIEEIHRAQGVIGTSKERSWGLLGTPERMAELERDIKQAIELSATASPAAQQRVRTWTVGVWDYMKSGFDAYAGTGLPTWWNMSSDDTHFTTRHLSGSPPTPLPDAGTFRLLNGPNQTNSVGFDRTAVGAYDRVSIRVDFAANPSDGGFSVLMLDTASHGSSGPCPILAQSPLPFLPNAFGVGFDFRNRQITTGWNGHVQVEVPAVSFDFCDGRKHSAVITIENDRPKAGSSSGAYLSLSMDGKPLYQRANLRGVRPYESRFGLMAGSGPAESKLHLHSFRVEYQNRVKP